ncbi:MAG TPA: helix-turn-helix domain-containing protein [Ignavibacteria bacterium]
MRNLSEIIKFHRKKSGLSQKELADLAGVGKTVIFDLEKGKETVQWSTVSKIISVLNVKIRFESSLLTQKEFNSDEKSKNI